MIGFSKLQKRKEQINIHMGVRIRKNQCQIKNYKFKTETKNKEDRE
jgi:hypothetical protein